MLGEQALQGRPLLARRTPIARKASICAGHQAGMVVLVALERQAEALDGVDDEELGLVVRPRPARRRRAGAQVMAARLVIRLGEARRRSGPGWRAPAGAAEIGEDGVRARRRRPGSSAPRRGRWGSRRSSRERLAAGLAKAASSLRPYFRVMTSQPSRGKGLDAAEHAVGVVASRLWRL